MRYNLKRHKILESLSKNHFEANSEKRSENFRLGLSFLEIDRILKVNPFIREKICSKLLSEKEIGYTNTQVTGFFLTDKGFDSYSSEKYIIENNKIIVKYIKNFVQIAIPILSLVIAVLALSLKFNSITKNIEEKVNSKNEKQIKSIELKLDSILNLQNKKKNSSNTLNSKND